MNSRLHQRARLVRSLPNEDSFPTGQTKRASRIFVDFMRLRIAVFRSTPPFTMALSHMAGGRRRVGRMAGKVDNWEAEWRKPRSGPRALCVVAGAAKQVHRRNPISMVAEKGFPSLGLGVRLPQIPSSWHAATNRAMLCRMAELLQFIWSVLTGLFRSCASREAEIAACAISSTCCIGNHRSGRHLAPSID